MSSTEEETVKVIIIPEEGDPYPFVIKGYKKLQNEDKYPSLAKIFYESKILQKAINRKMD